MKKYVADNLTTNGHSTAWDMAYTISIWSYELRGPIGRAIYKNFFAGVTVSNSTFNSLILRYSDRDGKIYFNHYINCIARLCAMFGMQLHGRIYFITTSVFFQQSMLK